MRILIACEFSGTIRRAFTARGFDAWSCDLLPAEDRSNRHITGDVREVLTDGWDMMIVAHPPCTSCNDTGYCDQTEKSCTCEAGLNLDAYDDDSGECANCGGEGFTYGCSWDWQCDTYDEGEGTCLCTRRCDWCNPAKLTPEQEVERQKLRAVLSDALKDITP